MGAHLTSQAPVSHDGIPGDVDSLRLLTRIATIFEKLRDFRQFGTNKSPDGSKLVELTQMDNEKKQKQTEQVVRERFSRDDLREAFRSNYKAVATDERFGELLKRLDHSEKASKTS